MGRLTTSDAYGGHIVGYHPDAFVLSIGHAGRITLHPDQFTGGEWGVDDTSRMLTVTMGAVTVHVRAGR